MAKTKEKTTTKKQDNTPKESALYFFYTQGCGWCKKVMPHVDALNKEGYDILKLDLAEGDNRKLLDEVKKEYGHQCGTPYFVDGETGNMICGHREKDVLEKWAKGEKIPQPVRPTGPPPKVPFMGAGEKDIDKWKEQYEQWLEKNSKLENTKTADELLALPRPKSDPPRPPIAQQATDEELEKWGKEYDVWAKENDHLPKIMSSEDIIKRIKQQKQQQATMQQNQGGGSLNPDQNARLQRLEQKVDKLIKHLGVQ